MLYVLYKANHEYLTYRGGQDRIIHLEADMLEAVEWAEDRNLRWAFTLSNAGSRYFEDRCGLECLADIDWDAVRAKDWRNCKEEKQAEFLVEGRFDWRLIRRIGVHNRSTLLSAVEAVGASRHVPVIEVMPRWYY